MNTRRDDLLMILVAVAGWTLFATAAAQGTGPERPPECITLHTGQTVMLENGITRPAECLPGIGELPPDADEVFPPLPRAANQPTLP